jgi:hypothetical protein
MSYRTASLFPDASRSMEEPPMKHNRRRSPGKPRASPTVFDRLNPNVAGIDCGSAEHFVAVPPGLSRTQRRTRLPRSRSRRLRHPAADARAPPAPPARRHPRIRVGQPRDRRAYPARDFLGFRRSFLGGCVATANRPPQRSTAPTAPGSPERAPCPPIACRSAPRLIDGSTVRRASRRPRRPS